MPDKVCTFCEFRCRIPEGARGRCGIRMNRNGELLTLGYAQAAALAIDPVEKKPLYHVLPGSRTLSVALFGCNYQCTFCQNHSLSQRLAYPTVADGPSGKGPPVFESLPFMNPRELARRMTETGLKSVSYTYSEPTVWQDYMFDCVREVRHRGGKNYLVSNGSFSSEARARIADGIDAVNIDLKGNEEFYRLYCGGMLKTVLANLEALAKKGSPIVEVSTMIIEGIHRTEDVLFLSRALEEAGVVVWHLSPFYPAYRMLDRKPTGPRYMKSLFGELSARSSLPYIYASLVDEGLNTRCPGCKRLLVSRNDSYRVEKHYVGNRCPDCGTLIYQLE